MRDAFPDDGTSPILALAAGRASFSADHFLANPIGHARITRSQAGFTLIEIMVVVVIIGLLLTVVASNVTRQLGTAESVKSRADIQGMETAMAGYRLDNGFYPTTEQGIEALIVQPTGEPVPRRWNGPYLKGHSTIPKDRWGNEYLYMSPGVHNPDSFDLWTRGQDGQDGGEGGASDIGNWESEPGEGHTTAAQ
jgi:general secretion pathway protein G